MKVPPRDRLEPGAPVRQEESFITLTGREAQGHGLLAVLRPAATNGPTDPAKTMETELPARGWIGARVRRTGGRPSRFPTDAPAGRPPSRVRYTDADRFALDSPGRGQDSSFEERCLRDGE
jgi:hypothetical protein